jgi:DnaJ like chaperone protein
MSIWVTIIGGAAGFALGGPLGALVGAAAGHAIDRMREDGEDHALGRETAFTIAVIALGAKMAKADGAVTPEEIRAFKEVFQVPPGEEEHVARVFNQARRDSAGFEHYARQVARMFRDNPAVLEKLLDGLFHIASADKVADAREIAFLREVATIFGFDAETFERIRAAHLGRDEADPYLILGVPHDAPDEQIRASWRRLVREHHPDRLTAQGLPEEFVALANDRLAAINAAYDSIKSRRGLKSR